MTRSSPDSTDIVDGLTLYYELAHCIGTSVDFRKNCDAFIPRLMSRRSLSQCLVVVNIDYWKKLNAVETEPRLKFPDSEFVLAYSFRDIEPENEAYLLQGDISARAIDEICFSLSTKPDETAYIHTLDHFGYIVCIRKSEKQSLNKWQLNQLQPVVDLFARSVQRCAEHETLLQAEAERSSLRASLYYAKSIGSVANVAGGVAHDLNNMLVPLLNYPELIRTKLQNNESIEEYLQIAEQAAGQAAELTADLMGLVQGALVTPNKPLRLDHCVQEFHDSPYCQDILRANPGIKLSSSYDGPATIIAATTLVFRTLLNLVNNAVEAQNGPGTIQIDVRQIKLTQTHNGAPMPVPAGNYHCLIVSDSGPGISPAVRETLFEPFVTTKTKSSSRGAGIGLAVVQGATSSTNGYINLTSQPGNTVFTLYFPAHQ